MSTFPNYSKFFKPNSSNKPFLVDLSQLYSNLFMKIVKFKGSLPESESTSVKTNISERKVENKYGETEVRKICQKQKMLSDGELIEIAAKYLSGASTYDLAKEYSCHRYTISNNLKRMGIDVSGHVEGRKYKTKEVIRLYVEEKKSVAELAKKFEVCDATIYKCLKRNGVYTKRTRWDYEK